MDHLNNALGFPILSLSIFLPLTWRISMLCPAGMFIDSTHQERVLCWKWS